MSVGFRVLGPLEVLLDGPANCVRTAGGGYRAEIGQDEPDLLRIGARQRQVGRTVRAAGRVAQDVSGDPEAAPRAWKP